MSAPLPPTSTVHASHAVMPDRIYVLIDGLTATQSRRLSRQAVKRAQAIAPKVTGQGARGIDTYWGTGFFGLRFRNPYLWFPEAGSRPRTMRSLANKTIPMWINDPTGSERQANPKAKVRRTVDGRQQVLIFRRAARIGQRKTVIRRGVAVDVPASYPGAPGRIARRTYQGGRIAKLDPRPHVGVRWRHPGIYPRGFMHHALMTTAQQAGLGQPEIHMTYRRR